jgi:hypothetical protein
MGTRVSCSRAECLRSAVTVLGDKDYCFDHFCSRCYELLERNQRLPGQTSSQEFREELAELDECARRALEISFGRVDLNNLDRARLLDILLWAGDLTTAVRHRRTAPPDLVSPSFDKKGRWAGVEVREPEREFLQVRPGQPPRTCTR